MAGAALESGRMFPTVAQCQPQSSCMGGLSLPTVRTVDEVLALRTVSKALLKIIRRTLALQLECLGLECPAGDALVLY
jgi:hypothetical protein